jgi:lipoate-protein ligase A
VLQHGSLPLGGDLSRIAEVLVFLNDGQRRAAAERLLEHAATAESILGHAVSWSAAAEAFTTAFESELGINLAPSVLQEGEARRADELVREKYAHSSWTQRV